MLVLLAFVLNIHILMHFGVILMAKNVFRVTHQTDKELEQFNHVSQVILSIHNSWHDNDIIYMVSHGGITVCFYTGKRG